MTMYFVVLAIFVAGFLLIYRTIHSPFGQVLKAIRENEPRAISLGYKADQYKLIAFALSAAPVRARGGHQGHRLPARLAHRRALDDVGRGGAHDAPRRASGRSSGRSSGAFVVIALENYLAQLGAWVTVVQGLIFIVCVLTFRRGIVGELARLLKKPL